MILANGEAQTRPYQYYVTVCLSVPPTKQFWEAQSSRFSGLFVWVFLWRPARGRGMEHSLLQNNTYNKNSSDARN